jgi:hypothetical protein
MKGLGGDALQFQLMPISCTFDPNYNQHEGHDDANGSQSQKHLSFSQHTLVPDSAEAGEDSSCGVSAASEPMFPDHVSAVSEANGTTVPVSLDLRSSLSIQPLEGSRSRVRRTRSAGNSIDFCLKSLARQGLWAKRLLFMLIDVERLAPRLGHPSSGTIRSQFSIENFHRRSPAMLNNDLAADGMLHAVVRYIADRTARKLARRNKGGGVWFVGVKAMLRQQRRLVA